MFNEELWIGELCATAAAGISKNSKMKKHELENFEVNEEEKLYNIRHRCYYFSKEVILFVKGCTYDKIYSPLFDQLIRSATSVGANLVESKAGSAKKDWKNFQVIALKSANETKYWLCLSGIQWKQIN
jgi:four helix bundle protein